MPEEKTPARKFKPTARFTKWSVGRAAVIYSRAAEHAGAVPTQEQAQATRKEVARHLFEHYGKNWKSFKMPQGKRPFDSPEAMEEFLYGRRQGATARLGHMFESKDAEGIRDEYTYFLKRLTAENKKRGDRSRTRFLDPVKGAEIRAKIRAARNRPDIAERIRQGVSKAAQKRAQDPAYREQVGKRFKQFWTDPANEQTRERMKREQGARMRARWQDPAFREKHTARLLGILSDPAFKRRRSERMRALWRDPAFVASTRARSSIWMKTLWEDPEFREAGVQRARHRFLRVVRSPEWRARHHKRMQELWATPEWRELTINSMRAASERHWEQVRGAFRPEFKARGLERTVEYDREGAGRAGLADTRTPDELSAQDEQKAVFLEAMEKLPDEEREVVHRLFYEGKTQDEVQFELGVTNDELEKLKAAALAKIADHVRGKF